MCSLTEELDAAAVGKALKDCNADAVVSAIRDATAACRATHPVAIKACYDFGAGIVENGKLAAPCGSPDCRSCAALTSAMAQVSVPLAVVVNGTAEVGLTIADRYAPLRVFRSGQLFGVFETLDKHYAVGAGVGDDAPWQIVAGSRAVEIMAPLADRRLSEALCLELGGNLVEVASLLKNRDLHWKVVQAIGAQQRTAND